MPGQDDTNEIITLFKTNIIGNSPDPNRPNPGPPVIPDPEFYLVMNQVNQFSKTQYANENVSFLSTLYRLNVYSRSVSPGQRAQVLTLLDFTVKSYIQNGSRYQVNLSAEQRNAILDAYNERSTNPNKAIDKINQIAGTEVLDLVSRNLLTPYIESPNYKVVSGKLAQIRGNMGRGRSGAFSSAVISAVPALDVPLSPDEAEVPPELEKSLPLEPVSPTELPGPPPMLLTEPTFSTPTVPAEGGVPPEEGISPGGE